MLVELRAKSQITLPKKLVEKLGLSEGDKLAITEQDGAIYLIPVTVYPKKYLNELKKEIEKTKNKISSGEQPVFNNIDELIEKLED